MKNLVNKTISWIAADGGAHIIVCILVSSIMSILINVYVGVIFTALLGIVKEVMNYDYKTGYPEKLKM